jgi:DNA polymerase I-like protein with 3'-5' exonuclease and polymerase domains
VLAYMERTRAQAAEQGFVETLFGRRLYLPDINARTRPCARRRTHGDQRADAGHPATSSSAPWWRWITG